MGIITFFNDFLTLDDVDVDAGGGIAGVTVSTSQGGGSIIGLSLRLLENFFRFLFNAANALKLRFTCGICK